MELFALNPEVETLERQLPDLEGQARLEILILLAWHMRQRHADRALSYADEAEHYLMQTGQIDSATGDAQLARICLVRAEIKWLSADLFAAETYAQSALSTFEQQADLAGSGDAKLILAFIMHERANRLLREENLQMAIADYTAVQDQVRLDVAMAVEFLHSAFQDAKGTNLRIDKLFTERKDFHVSVKAWLESAKAITSAFTLDPGGSIKHFLLSHHAALLSGQIRLAIVSACNGAESFATLGDLDSALEWNERALAKSRSTGWPSMIGFSLVQTSDVMRMLGRSDDAKMYLNEAISVMDKLRGSRFYALALKAMGEIYLDDGDLPEALNYFNQAEERVNLLSDPLFVLQCWRGQAKALGFLGQSEQALLKITDALAMAKKEGSADERIKVLRVYAQLCQRRAVPPPHGMTEQVATLHFLKLAMAIATSVNGYTMPSGLIDEIASAHADCGEFSLAYTFAKSAASARDNKNLNDAKNRAIAMQVRKELDQKNLLKEKVPEKSVFNP